MHGGQLPSYTFACKCLLPASTEVFDVVKLFKSERITDIRVPAVYLPQVWKGV